MLISYYVISDYIKYVVLVSVIISLIFIVRRTNITMIHHKHLPLLLGIIQLRQQWASRFSRVMTRQNEKKRETRNAKCATAFSRKFLIQNKQNFLFGKSKFVRRVSHFFSLSRVGVSFKLALFSPNLFLLGSSDTLRATFISTSANNGTNRLHDAKEREQAGNR